MGILRCVNPRGQANLNPDPPESARMTRVQPPRFLRAERPRAAERRRMLLTGSFGIDDRPRQEVLVTDLGPLGCSLQGDAVGVTRSVPLTLWVGEVGPIAGKLKWAKAGSLGMQFDTPLDEEVVAALYDAAAEAKVVPLRPEAAA